MNNNIELPRKRSHSQYTCEQKYSFSMLPNKLSLVKQGRKRLSICTKRGTFADRERGRERDLKKVTEKGSQKR